MESRIFWIHFTTERDGLWVTIEGRRAGPFADDLAAEVHVAGVMDRWAVKARALGGSVGRPAKRKIMVTLPDGASFKGGDPLVDERRR